MPRETPAIQPATGEALLVALVDRQQALGMSGAAFARHLGISRALWSLTVQGRRPIRRLLLAGVSHRFPELAEALLFVLASQAGQPGEIE